MKNNYIEKEHNKENHEDNELRLVNKVVRIIGTDSVFTSYLGRYGVVLYHAYADKWMIQFDSKVGNRGGISHTVREEDFEVVGEVYLCNQDENNKAYISPEIESSNEAAIEYYKELEVNLNKAFKERDVDMHKYYSLKMQGFKKCMEILGMINE